jgi:hypothetical protein
MHQHCFTHPQAVAMLDTCPTIHWRGNRLYPAHIRNTDGDASEPWVCFECMAEAMRIEEREQP